MHDCPHHKNDGSPSLLQKAAVVFETKTHKGYCFRENGTRTHHHEGNRIKGCHHGNSYSKAHHDKQVSKGSSLLVQRQTFPMAQHNTGDCAGPKSPGHNAPEQTNKVSLDLDDAFQAPPCPPEDPLWEFCIGLPSLKLCGTTDSEFLRNAMNWQHPTFPTGGWKEGNRLAVVGSSHPLVPLFHGKTPLKDSILNTLFVLCKDHFKKGHVSVDVLRVGHEAITDELQLPVCLLVRVPCDSVKWDLGMRIAHECRRLVRKSLEPDATCPHCLVLEHHEEVMADEENATPF